MNDLAERALHGLDAGRRQVLGHPATSCAVAGFALAALVVVAGGEVGAAGSTRPLTTWFALQDTDDAAGAGLPASLMLGGVVALVLLWVSVLRSVHRRPLPIAAVWAIAGAWAAPFALGPPLLDTGIYSSAAYGLLQRSGHDPYTTPPTRLGGVAVVTAIDPGARGTPSAAGALGSVLQHLAVSVGNGSALGAVIVLRVLGVLAFVWIGRSAIGLAASHADRALALTVLNPLTLLYVVSAAHLDGLMVALVLAALLAAQRRRWPAAVGWASLAGAVSAQALVLLPVLVIAHLAALRASARPPRILWRALGRDTAVAAVLIAGLGLVVTDGFGWAWSARQQFATHTPFSVAGAISAVLHPMVPGASYDDLEIGARVTVLVAMACALGYLLVTANHRPLDHTAAYALLSIALLAPSLHPWYLLWGVLCLAARASGPHVTMIAALSAAGCVLDPEGFGGGVRNLLTATLLLVIAVAALAAGAGQRPPEISRTAGRTSAR